VKIEYHEDIAAPADFVFRRLSDVDRHERQALRRGVEVVRLGGTAPVGPGSAWSIAFNYRGRRRTVRAEITDLTPPRRLRIDAVAGGLNFTTLVMVVPLSPTLTRVNVTVNLAPQTITARLLVQSLKLARGTVTDRLKGRLTELGAEIATAWSRRQT
jgi:uncharacterized protein YndB with AHSA1/START domain